MHFVIGLRLDVSLDGVMSKEMKSEFLIYAPSGVLRRKKKKRKAADRMLVVH